MRIFIFTICFLITMINCSPLNRNAWSSSSRVRVIHRAPMKPRKVISGLIFNIVHPVPLTQRKELPLRNNERIYFPGEVSSSEEEMPQKMVVTRSRKVAEFSERVELPTNNNNRDYFDEAVSSSGEEMPQNMIVSNSGNFSNNFNHHKSISGLKVNNLDSLVPKCSGESTFCENVPAYPYEMVNKMLKNFDNKDFFGLEENDVKPWSRADNNNVDNFMCESYTAIVHPQMGKTLDGKWKYIINVDNQEYVQAVKVEICKNPKKPCAMSNNFPKDIITSCKQRYMNRRLLSISNNGLPEADIYSLPAGCSCTYKRDPQSMNYLYGK